jgi:hypothetical protein
VGPRAAPERRLAVRVGAAGVGVVCLRACLDAIAAAPDHGGDGDDIRFTGRLHG